ncbi:hypothetical protein IF2G_07397 [Cordyceps javanica]|nr:hypothetical protein IF2G_07397 [Cordyceps javanica]
MPVMESRDRTQLRLTASEPSQSINMDFSVGRAGTPHGAPNRQRITANAPNHPISWFAHLLVPAAFIKEQEKKRKTDACYLLCNSTDYLYSRLYRVRLPFFLRKYSSILALKNATGYFRPAPTFIYRYSQS